MAEGHVKHVASASFGKDSMATIILALEHGEPLDYAVYCEVMFDDVTSGEVPEHREFVYGRAIPFLEKHGVKTVILHSDMTYIRSFFRVLQKGKCTGRLNSWPLCGKCCIQRDCKLRPLNAYQKSLGRNTVQYIGIACDENERLARLKKGREISLLDKYQKTEADAVEICKAYGLYSPVYGFSERNGCFFCPNAGLRELRHLYDHHPELWARLLELQKVPNKATELFNRTDTIDEIDGLFQFEDAHFSLFDEDWGNAAA